ncbi:FadR/GntR family transcriptional regulator [Nocardioides gilvus]|uniref:FadR/GntR family transcriptional regulator n=1 Tax=Nocardioides gilvus TaxID=1735589 RepID=UPI000D742D67|nr:FCD domain-containing protein [Nocardioides gilvus]
MHGVVVESLGSGIALGQITGTLDLDEIAAHFQVSRSLIREALRTLAAKGMVVARQKTGTKVTAQGEWAALDEHVIRWRAAGPERFAQLHDSLEVRERLEPLAARRMAESGPGSALEALRRAAGEIETANATQDTLLMLRADTAFHRALYLGSGNDFLAEMAGTVHACLRVPDFQRFHRFSPSTAVRHHALARAIADGDAEAAESMCAEVMAQTRALFTEAHHALRSQGP